MVDKKTAVDYIKALEESGLAVPKSHTNDKFVELVVSIVSMTEEEHEAYQKEKPNKGVRMLHNEFQDWKETYYKEELFNKIKDNGKG